MEAVGRGKVELVEWWVLSIGVVVAVMMEFGYLSYALGWETMGGQVKVSWSPNDNVVEPLRMETE
jgi:hypothetical protein